MSGNYYERLGVEQTADAGQIKRAYFTMVKQYPPERFPEEFKELRAAYDTLSDGKRRAEYDRASELPQDAAYLFEQAKKAEQIGRYPQAAEIYKNILQLYPDLTPAQTALARSFERQGKNGKAIAIWEKLCAGEPENADYAYELAVTYDQRSWRMKAIAQYWRALGLDSGNVGCWTALLNCHTIAGEWQQAREVCRQGIAALKKLGRENLQLYAYGFMLSFRENAQGDEQYLRDIVRVMRSGGTAPDEHPQETISFLLDVVIELQKPKLIRYIQEMADTLLEMSGDLRDRLAEASRYLEIETLEDKGFDVLFHDLLGTLENDCDCEDCRLDLMAMECNILGELNSYRPQLLRLKEEYPHLYELHAAFFNEALRTRETQKMLYKRLKELSKKGVSPAGFQPEDEDEYWQPPAQPVRRTEPKVGRNDPCPCGSGKKYKKCCGA